MVDSFLKVNQNKVKWTIFLDLIDIDTPILFLFYRNNPALILDLKIFKLIGYANIQNIENKNFESILESSLFNKKLKLTVPKGELEDIAIAKKNNSNYEFLLGKLSKKFSNESYISAIKFCEIFIEMNRPQDILMTELTLKSLEKFDSDITFLVCLYNIILGREIDWIGRNAYFGEKHKFRLNSEWRFYCSNELFKSDEYKNSGNNYLRILEIILNL